MTLQGDDPARLSFDVSQAIQAARAELAAIDQENQRAHFEYQLMLRSKARRWLLRVNAMARTALTTLLNPFDGAVYLVRMLARRVGITALQPAWEYAAYRSHSLRGSPIASASSNRGDASRAVRWGDVTRVGGVPRQALHCVPSSTVRFDVSAAAGASLTAHCAILPEAWLSGHPSVRFTIDIRCHRDGWHVSRSRTLDPRRLRDRGWRPLSVPLPHAQHCELEISLSTAAEHPGTDIPAIWGDPQLRWRRSLSAVVRGARAHLQQAGLRGALRRVGQLRDADAAAATYHQWVARQTLSTDTLAQQRHDAAALAYRPVISIITPVYNTDPAWLRACVGSVLAQTYPHWELCLADDASDSAATRAALDQLPKDPRIKLTRLAVNGHISAASNAALELATGEFVAMLDHDDALPPDALFEIAQHLNVHRDADIIYTDEDKLEVTGQRCDPFFKPDWSPELFASYMYTCHLMVYRRSVVAEVGGFRIGFEGAQDYDLALRAIEHTDRIHHVPRILYHWRKIPGSAAAEVDAKPWALANARRALEEHAGRTAAADVVPGLAPGLFRLKYRIAGQPLVTLLVPTDDRTRDVNGRPVRLLTNALRSVVQKTAYANYEILVVDNGTLSEESMAFLDGVPHRRVSYSYSGPFNFAHKLNFSVAHARGSQLLFFNDDLEVINSEWLTAMLEYAQQPSIGAVGAKLLFPDGRLQHIGAVLGVCGVAAHAFHMHPGWSTGYAGSAIVARNYSAVSGACMMTRRDAYDAAGGWNERLAIDFNDVDYCLRLRRAGFRIVYTPYAQLYHLESGSHGPRTQNPAELEEMQREWSAVLANDPYYHPSLTRDFPDFRLRLD